MQKENGACTAYEAYVKFHTGERSAEQLVQSCLDRIEETDGRVKAFLAVFEKRALEKARLLDTKRARGAKCGQLAGVTVAVKDNILVKGERTTCASRILERFVAPFDATAIERLEAEDAIVIGKTNLDEFAMGSSCENSAFFPSCNPWNLACTPGGSSGGSAAAVTAGMCSLALGSDTGGSVRLPGSFCGITAFKPTYGRVSRYGLVAFGSSLDQIGTFARSAEDVEMAMKTMGVFCPRDSTSLRDKAFEPVSFQDRFSKGFTIGVPFAFLKDLSEEPRQVFTRSIEHLRSLGAQVVEIDLSLLSLSVAIYYILATAELSTNLARFDGIRYGLRSEHAHTLDEVYTLSREEGFGKEVKRRLMLGTFVLSAGYQDAYYKKAQKVRALMAQQFSKAFSVCDTIAMPVSTSCAFPFGSKKDPLSMYLEDIYTIGPNLVGLPAVSIPSGTVKDLPYGLQLIGPQRQDAEVLSVAKAFQEKTSYHTQRPIL